jgi:hypothetical protein
LDETEECFACKMQSREVFSCGKTATFPEETDRIRPTQIARYTSMEHTVVESVGGSVDHGVSAAAPALASSSAALALASSAAAAPALASSASAPALASSTSTPALASSASASASASAYLAANPYSWLYVRERLYAIFSLLWTKKEPGAEMDGRVRQQEVKNVENLLEMLENAEEDALNTVKQETSALIDDIMADLQRLESQCAAILSHMPQR